MTQEQPARTSWIWVSKASAPSSAQVRRDLAAALRKNWPKLASTLTLNARTEATLRATADAIADQYGVKVQIVAEDVTTEAGRNALLKAEPQPDILVNNAGGPPAGNWSEWGEEEWLKAINNNMLTPILLMNAILPGMIERKWGRVLNITSGSVKSPIFFRLGFPTPHVTA